MLARTRRRVSLASAHLKRIAHCFEQEQRTHLQPMPITVTKHGKPILTIVPQELYDGLLETLEILEDKEQLTALRQGIKDADEGRVEPLDAVIKELGWEE